MAEEKPIIIVKKKGGHGGHHGGAWKVAYADFVTAMMAFFMVMWLLNSAEVATRQNIASYFRRPGIFAEGSGTPLMMGEAGILTDAYVPPHPSEDRLGRGHSMDKLQGKSGTDHADLPGRVTIKEDEEHMTWANKDQIIVDEDLVDEWAEEDISAQRYTGHPSQEKGKGSGVDGDSKKMELAKEFAEEIREQLAGFPKLKELLGDVNVKVEADGLNIEIMDTENTSMFKSASARFEPSAREAFAKIAETLKDVPNQIDILGHTDAMPFSSRRGGYSNWELSSDRANAARRLLETQGIPPNRIKSVVGRADRELKDNINPFGPSNRRITLRLRFDEELLAANRQKSEGMVEDLSQHTVPPQRKTKKKKKEDAWTRKDIKKAQKMREKPIKLPEAGIPGVGPRAVDKDKIFNESPVFGPADPFRD